MFSIMQVGQLLSYVQPAVGLILLVMGIMLIRRKADPAVVVLTAWGALWILRSLWGMYARSIITRTSALSTPPHWLNPVSGILAVGGNLFLILTALYALWRFWRASSR